MRKFKIPSIPLTTNKSIRFPNDLIEKVENAIRGQNCTFSAFVIEAVRVALENIGEKNDDNNKWNWYLIVLFMSDEIYNFHP